MALLDPDCVRRLLESADPDVALVFVRGECLVLPLDEIDERHRRLVVVRRADLPEAQGDEPVTEERVEALTRCLENTVRDLGA
ncbi:MULTISPECIES: hypothetical protein [Microbispora]|uniref:Uncharacterized protein n=1 Tax=Microbispora siamensis TaxID=564413 RepID=A0ABQ4GWQ4_9ACTN|nr:MULTISPECIES: hypothetical protein [Microbispora]OPG12281.1 hypothetical protein B1L11_15720 [Microbispora sp. GKU 823]GIH65842.1 hypothetical protein Msi02_66590 [Microbispora siamensis]